MAEVTATMVKELRERTQAGMSDCKNALVEAGGDMEKAVEIILKKGIVKAAARAGRVATEGEVRTWIAPDQRRGIIVEVNCQTDFVARGDDFKGFVGKVIEAAQGAKPGADLGALKFPGTDKTVDTVRQEMVAKTGENTVVRRWAAVDARGKNSIVHSYVHMGGKIAVLVEADAPSADAAKNKAFIEFVDNCAMQICAMNPMVVSKSEVSQQAIEKQKEIFQAQLKEENKPEQAWPKIVDGKVAKWLNENSLLGAESGIKEKVRSTSFARSSVSSLGAR
jgi:elongation factor Ts